jgi:hypothetical protein
MTLISGIFGLEPLIDSMAHGRFPKAAAGKVTEEKPGVVTGQLLLQCFHGARAADVQCICSQIRPFSGHSIELAYRLTSTESQSF